MWRRGWRGPLFGSPRARPPVVPVPAAGHVHRRLDHRRYRRWHGTPWGGRFAGGRGCLTRDRGRVRTKARRGEARGGDCRGAHGRGSQAPRDFGGNWRDGRSSDAAAHPRAEPAQPTRDRRQVGPRARGAEVLNLAGGCEAEAAEEASAGPWSDSPGAVAQGQRRAAGQQLHECWASGQDPPSASGALEVGPRLA